MLAVEQYERSLADQAVTDTSPGLLPSDNYAAILPSLHPPEVSEHVILWTTLPDRSPGWVDIAEDAARYVSRRLDVKPDLRIAVMFVVRDGAEMARLGAHLDPSFKPTSACAYFFAAVPALLIRHSSTLTASIAHEATHYVVRGVAAYVPDAINEGAAVFLTEEFLARRELLAPYLKRKRRSRAKTLARASQRIPPLRDFLETSYWEFHGTDEATAYDLSWCLAKVLLDERSLWAGRLGELLGRLDQPSEVWANFASTYPAGEIERLWRVEILEQARADTTGAHARDE